MPSRDVGLIGYGIAMTFLSHTYFIYPYLLYAITGIAAKVYAPKKDETVAPAASAALPAPQPEPLPS